MVQRRQGRWLEALDNLKAAQRIEPANPEYTQETGILLLAGCRYGEAEAALRRADALGRTGNFLATYKLLLGLWSRGDLSKESPTEGLLVGVRRDVALMRGEPPASTGAARAVDEALVRAARGERDAARALLEEPAKRFRQQLSPDSTSPGAWENLAMMEALLGNRDEALRCAKRQTDLHLASPDLWAVRNRPSALAFVHAWTGDSASALAELARTLQLACRPINTNINVHTSQDAEAARALRISGKCRFVAFP